MLQYNTGKFLQYPDLKCLIHENIEILTLYSNFQPKKFSNTIIKTNAGDLSVHNDGVLMYKLKQKSLAFQGAAYNPFKDYANDFAALLTFFTGALFLSEKDVFERLISKRQSLNISTPACQLISPYFEEEVIISDNTWREFSIFVADLLNLPQKKYVTTIKAIRGFVEAIYRIKDDLTLAYTLLIASAESLAQEFCEYKASWKDINPNKAEKLEKEFNKLSEAGHSEVIENIKNLLIKKEHLKLKHRYREFLMNHLPNEWFYCGNSSNDIGKEEIKRAIANSYNLRSGYVHNLQRLPNNLIQKWHSENIITTPMRNNQNEPYLTLRGLAKVIRKAILQFVQKSEKTPNEEAQYLLASTKHALWAKVHPNHWFFNSQKLIKEEIQIFLDTAFNHLLNKFLSKEIMKFSLEILQKVEKLWHQLNKSEKTKFATFYAIYVFESRLSDREKFFNQNILNEALDHLNQTSSIETLALHFFYTSYPSQYSTQDIDKLLDEYLKSNRYKTNYTHLDPIIQAGIIADFIGFCSSKNEQSLAKKWLKIGKENFIERIFHETCFWGTCEASLRTKKPIESLSILFPPLLLLENAS